MDQKLHIKLSALNADFSSLYVLTPGFKKICARGRQRGVPPKSSYFTAISLSSEKTTFKSVILVSYHL